MKLTITAQNSELKVKNWLKSSMRRALISMRSALFQLILRHFSAPKLST